MQLALFAFVLSVALGLRSRFLARSQAGVARFRLRRGRRVGQRLAVDTLFARDRIDQVRCRVARCSLGCSFAFCQQRSFLPRGRRLARRSGFRTGQFARARCLVVNRYVRRLDQFLVRRAQRVAGGQLVDDITRRFDQVEFRAQLGGVGEVLLTQLTLGLDRLGRRRLALARLAQTLGRCFARRQFLRQRFVQHLGFGRRWFACERVDPVFIDFGVRPLFAKVRPRYSVEFVFHVAGFTLDFALVLRDLGNVRTAVELAVICALEVVLSDRVVFLQRPALLAVLLRAEPVVVMLPLQFSQADLATGLHQCVSDNAFLKTDAVFLAGELGLQLLRVLRTRVQLVLDLGDLGL